MAGEKPPEPWHSFLQELDQQLTGETRLHCLGGFVITVCYGLTRPTSDVDFLSSIHSNHVLTLGQEGTALHRKYGVYLQAVSEPTLPENYGDRVVEMFPSIYGNLRLFALDPYDLALSKLERNRERDRDDIKYLATHVPLVPEKLMARYKEEMRPYLSQEAKHDLTVQLWVQMIQEVRASRNI